MENIPQNSAELTFNHILILISRLWKLLWSKWKLLVVVGFTGGIIGIIYGWLETPQYEADLSFSTSADGGSALGGLAGIAAQFGVSIGSAGDVFTGDNVLTLISSRKMVIKTLLDTVEYNGKKTSLLNQYLDATKFSKAFHEEGIYKGLSFPLGQDPKTYSRLQDSVLMLVADALVKFHLTVDRPDKKLQVFQLTCISEDEFFSKTFTTNLLNNVSDFYTETKTARAKETVDAIQFRADSVKRAYDAALYGRATLADANLNPAFQQPQVSVQKKQTDISVLAAAYGEILKNLEIAKFTLMQNTPFIQVIDEPMLPLKVVKTGRLLGGIIGGLLAGFLCVAYILIMQAFKNIKEEKKGLPTA